MRSSLGRICIKNPLLEITAFSLIKKTTEPRRPLQEEIKLYVIDDNEVESWRQGRGPGPCTSVSGWLKYVADRGYLLHGSAYETDSLMPPAGRSDGRLYATSYPELAIFYATRPRVKRSKCGDYFSAEISHFDVIFRASRELIHNRQPGYV